MFFLLCLPILSALSIVLVKKEQLNNHEIFRYILLWNLITGLIGLASVIYWVDTDSFLGAQSFSSVFVLSLVSSLSDVIGLCLCVTAITLAKNIKSSIQIMATVPIITLVMEVAILKESIGLRQMQGVIVAFLGGCIVTGITLKKEKLIVALLFFLAAIFYSIRMLTFRYAVYDQSINPAAWSAAFFCMVVIINFLLLLLSKTLISSHSMSPDRGKSLLKLGGIAALSFVFVSLSSIEYSGSITSSVRRTAPLLVAVYHTLFLKESASAHLFIGGFLIIIGLILVIP